MTIGIYDSGLGGLSVWRELCSRIRAPFVYFGDTAHLPYGDKSPDQLLEYFNGSLAFLQSRGCRTIVVACNTTSSVVLPRLKHLVQEMCIRDRSYTGYQTILLEHPARLVIDLYGVQGDPPPMLEVDSSVVSAVRASRFDRCV